MVEYEIKLTNSAGIEIIFDETWGSCWRCCETGFLLEHKCRACRQELGELEVII